jgi:hypothetical protein
MPGLKDSGKLDVNLGAFVGGESIDFKNGIANSFYRSEALDFRSKASQMSVLPGVAALPNATALVDLPVEMVQDPTGVRWIIGDQGNLYKLDTSNVLTKVATLSEASGTGMVYNPLSDFLYITGQQSVSLYGPLSSSPALKDGIFGESVSSANGVVNLYDPTTTAYSGAARNNAATIATTQGITATSQLTTNATATYSVPSAIDETSTNNRCAFAPDLEPFSGIALYVDTKGTGNATLELHDGFNRVLASITISNAALTTGYNKFVFPAPGIRSFTGAIQSGLSAAYHWHIKSSVAADTMKVRVLTAGNLSTADMVLFNYRMVQTNNKWHPAALFTGNVFMLCIGNGQYLSTYNFANDSNPSNYVYQRQRFPIDAGYEVCGLAQNDQYLVIAGEKRSSNATRNFQEGALYFWDGQNPSYNFKIPLPMGAPYSVYTFGNITYMIIAGALYAWSGGKQVIKVRPIAYQNTDFLNATDSTIVNPNMMAPRNNLLLVGYPSTTTNTQIKHGVYSWGAVELIYPNSFGYSYRLSHAGDAVTGYTKTASNNLQIGMIKNFVDTLYVASRKTVGGVTTYYLDVLDNNSKPAPYFDFTALLYDGGVRYKQKEMCRYKVNFLPWPANATLNVWYAIDRGAQKTADASGAVYSPNTGDTSIVIDVPNGRFYEGQWGFFGTCNNPGTPPTFTGVTMEIDPLQSEADLRSDDVNEGG